MGQEKVCLLNHVLLACFCAIPMNSDPLLEIQGASVDISKPALSVTFHTVTFRKAFGVYDLYYPSSWLKGAACSKLWEKFSEKICANGHSFIC